MHWAGFITALSTAVSLALAKPYSSLPVSATSYAYSRGGGFARNPVTVDLIIDLTCSSCQEAWPVISQVVKKYQHSVTFRYRVFPLPYHNSAYVAAKAAAAVEKWHGSEVFEFIDACYEGKHATAMSNMKTNGKTHEQVIGVVGSIITAATHMTAEEYEEAMDQSTAKGSEVETATRLMWKNCAMHGAFGTPTYLVNGVEVGDLQSQDDWKAILDPLLQGESVIF